MSKPSTESLAADLRLYNLQNFYFAVVNLTIAAGTAAVLWLGTRRVLSGDLSIGEIVVFTSYLASLYTPLDNIFHTYGLVQSAKVGVRRAFEILESEESMPEGPRSSIRRGRESRSRSKKLPLATTRHNLC